MYSNQNIDNEEEFNMLLYNFTGIYNDDKNLLSENNISYTNLYNFNTSPISVRSRNTIANRLLEETFNTILSNDLYDSIYERTLNTSFEENRERELERKEDKYINFTCQRYDILPLKIIKEQTECSICLSNFEKENMVSITSCKHIFHHDCIKEWTHYKSNCPVCREDL